MSLINDALKRARQSQQQQTAPVAPTLPPAVVEPRGGPPRLFIVVVTLLIAVACCFIAFVFFMPQKTVARITPAPQNAPTAAVAPVLQKVAPTPAPAPTVAVAAPKPAPPAPPALKVQGIFYNDAKWQAIVNGQSVFVGDSVEGFRVKLISKNNVAFVAPDGTVKTMALGE